MKKDKKKGKGRKGRSLADIDPSVNNFFEFSKQFFDHPERLEAFPDLVVFASYDSLVYKLLTPKRLELASFIRKNRNKKLSVSEIAEKLGRKQEAVSRDLKILVEAGLVEMHHIGKEHIAVGAKACLVVSI